MYTKAAFEGRTARNHQSVDAAHPGHPEDPVDKSLSDAYTWGLRSMRSQTRQLEGRPQWRA